MCEITMIAPHVTKSNNKNNAWIDQTYIHLQVANDHPIVCIEIAKQPSHLERPCNPSFVATPDDNH